MPHALRTLVMTSMFVGEKNQKYPVSAVRGTAVPVPLPVDDCHEVVTLNRPLFRQRVSGAGVQPPGPATHEKLRPTKRKKLLAHSACDLMAFSAG
jgi:hypothetical protein